jgi:hypothetical protein
MLMICDTLDKHGQRIGGRQVKTVTPRAADKIYEKIIKGPTGERLRQGEKAVGLCRKVWKVMQRLYPDQFDRQVPNPWLGTVLKKRTKAKKHAVAREEVYEYAWGCIKQGRPEPAAVAVICFEWLQRPENVVAGLIKWADYRTKKWPNAIRIFHHKTGALVWHPLDDPATGEKFYAEAEEVLSHLPKLGIPMIMQHMQKGEKKGQAILWSYTGLQKAMKKLRKELKVSPLFTFDACRHGGMTELEEAELTDGQGMALSGHRTKQAYRGYAKETMKRAVAATRKRHAFRLQAEEEQERVQEQTGMEFRNGRPEQFRNDESCKPANDVKYTPRQRVKAG